MGKLLKNIFTKFGTLRAIISNEGTHFCIKQFESILSKYGVKHCIAIAYHPQTNGQAELPDREVKRILEKVVHPNRKVWVDKLDNSLWAYRMHSKHHWAPHLTN